MRALKGMARDVVAHFSTVEGDHSMLSGAVISTDLLLFCCFLVISPSENTW